MDANLPLVHRQTNLLCVRGGRIFADGAGFAIDKGTSLGRIFQQLQNGGNGGLFPHHITKAISSWQAQIVRIEKLQDFVGRSDPKKRGENESQAIGNFPIGVFVNLANGIARQADGKR